MITQYQPPGIAREGRPYQLAYAKPNAGMYAILSNRGMARGFCKGTQSCCRLRASVGFGSPLVVIYITTALPLLCRPILATYMAPREGIEPPLTVLETAALPVYYPGIVWWTLKELNLTANHPTYYGNGFTVRRREQDPCTYYTTSIYSM